MADPQVNPNALGAPTEGFGQTVTFAFDPRGVTPSLELAKSTGPRVGVSGVSQGQMQNPNQAYQKVRTDGTADLLMRVAGELIGPKLEEERNRKFVEGIQQAMNGEAVKDMVAEQPWYSRLFGDTPAIEGARAYEVSSKVNRVMADEAANMDKVKHLGPKEAAAHYSQLLNKQLTGDPATDTLIAKTLVEQMPSLMKAQAKAHYGYGQKLAMDHLSTNMGTAFEALQQAGQLYAEGHINDEDMKLRKKSTVLAVMPPEGINEENYVKVMANRLKNAAEQGQFHAVAAMKEHGGFAALPVEKQLEVDKAIAAAAKRHRDNYAFQYVEQIAELRSDSANLPQGHTVRSIQDRYKAMDTAFRRLTGNPEGLFSSDEIANGVTAAFNSKKADDARLEAARQTLADKARTAQEKELAKALIAEEVAKNVAFGDVRKAMRVPGASDDQVHEEVSRRFQEDGAQGMNLLRNAFIKGAYVNPMIRDAFQAHLRNSEALGTPSNDFNAAFVLYKTLQEGPGGSALAQAYFPDYAQRLEQFGRMTGWDPSHPDAGPAFLSAMDRTKASKPLSLGDKEIAKMATDIAKKESYWLPEWAGGGIDVGKTAIGKLTNIGRQSAEDWKGYGGVSEEEAIKRGVSFALSSGRVELLAGIAIDRAQQTGEAGPKLRDLDGIGPDGQKVTIPSKRHDEYFKRFLATKRVDTVEANILKAGDTYTVTFQDDGVTRFAQFNTDEYRRFAGELALKDTRPADYSPWTTGPAYDWKKDYTDATVKSRAAIVEYKKMPKPEGAQQPFWGGTVPFLSQKFGSRNK